MHNPFNRQSQFELFPGSLPESTQKDRAGFFNRSFRLSTENIIILGIVIIMICVVSFSFGVESGKRLVRDSRGQAAAASSRLAVSIAPAAIVESQGSVNVSQPEILNSGSYEDVKSLEIGENIKQKVASFEKSIDKIDTLEKIHTIQVASFKEKSLAQREADDLAKVGYESFIAKKGSYYIVCVGRFSESSQAKPLHKGLKKKYSDSYIRSL